MSFFSDLFEGNFDKLGTDITHAGSSLMRHPSEMYETLGGLGALATGGLALGALAPEAAILPELGLGAGGDALGFAAPEVASAVAEAPTQSALTSLLSGTAAPSADTAFMGAGATADPTIMTAADPAYGVFNPMYTGTNYGGSAESFMMGQTNPGLVAGAADTTGSVGTGLTPIASGTSLDALGGVPGVAADPSIAAQGLPKAAAAGGWFGPGSVLGGLGIQSPLQAAGVAAGLGGLGYQFLKGQQPLADQAALESQAGQMSAQGQRFMSYLQRGKLPPGLQTLVDKQTQAAKTMAISNAARMGQSTDPTQNSQLASQITLAQQQATMQVALLGERLFKMGLDEARVSTEIEQFLVRMDEQQTKDMGQAIMNFAAAMSGGGMMRKAA